MKKVWLFFLMMIVAGSVFSQEWSDFYDWEDIYEMSVEEFSKFQAGPAREAFVAMLDGMADSGLITRVDQYRKIRASEIGTDKLLGKKAYFVAQIAALDGADYRGPFPVYRDDPMWVMAEYILILAAESYRFYVGPLN